MDFDDDRFPPSLPPYQSPPHIVDTRDLTEGYNNPHAAFTDPSDYLFDGINDNNLTDVSSQKPSPHILKSSSSEYLNMASPPQGSASDSQSNSPDASDSSSGEASMEDKDDRPGRISIPEDHARQQQIPGSQVERELSHDESAFGQFFDFDSAAGSPINITEQSAFNKLKMPMRSGRWNNRTEFSNESFNDVIIPLKGSPLQISPPQLYSSSDSQPKYIHGPQLHTSTTVSPISDPHQAPTASPPSSDGHEQYHGQSALYTNELPKTQRVETQMHVRLTIRPLPPGVSKVHFQSYTMARTKLVQKPTPQRSPAMLELYAHCVCATAMENEEKKRQAFERAARTTRQDESAREDDGFHSRSLHMADNDPKKPINGGFVFICDQCIRRENKRLGRKKLKNQEGEESWLEDQPKRIIVFNKAEVMEWQEDSSCNSGEEGEEAPTRTGTKKTQYSDNAMQIQFPMRIQCYSRHHGEKLGYRVIFTIKDYKDRLVAQTMTNASIITDDHKAQQSTKLSSDLSTPGYFANSGVATSGLPAYPGPTLQGPPLGNRNSFSTPDLQSLRLSYHARAPASQASASNLGDQIQSSSGLSSSRNGSRPVSPSTPAGGPQSKRRKGSGTGSARLRSDLMMTKINRNGPKSPPNGAPFPAGPGLAVGPLAQPFSPNYVPPYGYPASIGYTNSDPSTPGAPPSNFHQRSQSVENMGNYQGLGSISPSAWQSQAASAESSPQPHTQPQVHSQPLTSSMSAIPPVTNPHNMSIVRKTTPTEGPSAGGIEVTCLGEGFTHRSQVFFGDVAATRTSFWSPQAIVCLLPPAASAGFVNVNVRNLSDHFVQPPPPPQDPVLFRYIDNNEQNLMSLSFHLLQQQFMGNPNQAHEFTQKLFASLGQGEHGLPMDHTGYAPQQRHSQSYSFTSVPRAFQNLEDVVLMALEIVDLDEKANQTDVNQRGMSGQSMLHLGAWLNYYRLVAGLLARGADVDIRDNNGITPMHLASLRGNCKIIRKLRSSGADPTIRSLDGKRPGDLATTQQIRRTIDDVGVQTLPCTKAVTSTRHMSRIGSPASLTAHPVAQKHVIQHKNPQKPNPVRSNRDGINARVAQPGMVPPAWPSPAGRDTRRDSRKSKPISKDHLSPDAATFAANPAMSAWKDQISAQIQQLQQNLQRALPIPALPDYQDHPVMRRISNLVPQRAIRSHHSMEPNDKLKHADYHWWELITGSSSSPPSYEEIYPANDEGLNNKKTSAFRAVDDAIRDRSCEATHDACLETSMGTVNLDRGALTRQQQQQIRKAHALKVKKIRSDRKLFFIWIPILVFILTTMLFDRASDIWRSGCHVRIFLKQRVQGAIAGTV